MELIALVSTRGRGTYRLLTELNAAETELVTLREDEEAASWDSGELGFISDPDLDEDWETEATDRDDAVKLRAVEDVEFGCWWFTEPGCPGEVHCDCGPATLLEVLTHTQESLRQAAVDAHVQRMTELWAHYWSGEGLLSGSSCDFADACVDCIVEGVFHLGAVYEAASALAEELGEGVAAYHSRVSLDQQRYL